MTKAEPYTLHLGEALEFMASLEAGSVDALISDPPYGTTQLEWDKPIDWPTFWREAYRICKPEAVQVMFSAQPFTTDLINSNRKRFRYELIWQKTNPQGFLNANKRPLTCHENVLVFGRGGGTYNPQMWMSKPKGIINRKRNQGHGKSGHYGTIKDNVQVNNGERFPLSVICVSNAARYTDNSHPTQKPDELMAYLVQTYSNPGDLILDPFAGSGSTGVAAIKEGRRFIGSELSPEYHAIALKRLEAAWAQPKLFAA